MIYVVNYRVNFNNFGWVFYLVLRLVLSYVVVLQVLDEGEWFDIDGVSTGVLYEFELDFGMINEWGVSC